jgi:hypothetical protein
MKNVVILLSGTSGRDSLALLVCELSNRRGSQLGGDEEQLGQITRVLLLKATPGRVAGETAIGNFTYVDSLSSCLGGMHQGNEQMD